MNYTHKTLYLSIRIKSTKTMFQPKGSIFSIDIWGKEGDKWGVAEEGGLGPANLVAICKHLMDEFDQCFISERQIFSINYH